VNVVSNDAIPLCRNINMLLLLLLLLLLGD